MAHRRSGYIQIDASEVLNEIDDDDLIDEVKARKLAIAADADGGLPDMVKEAYQELLIGRHSVALAILQRVLFPKWPDKEAAQKAYDAAKKGTAS